MKLIKISTTGDIANFSILVCTDATAAMMTRQAIIDKEAARCGCPPPPLELSHDEACDGRESKDTCEGKPPKGKWWAIEWGF